MLVNDFASYIWTFKIIHPENRGWDNKEVYCFSENWNLVYKMLVLLKLER